MTESPQHQQPNSPTNTFVPSSGILVLEKETRQLKKELLEQKILFQEYRMKTNLQLEEARVKEERLLKSNEET